MKNAFPRRSDSGRPRIACAGWTIRPEAGSLFPTEGSHLARYASRLWSVEINSSFYFSHRHQTYVRWAASVPEVFRFAVKMPKQITHDCHLIGCTEALDQFLGEISGLGRKLGPVLIQFPPSFELSERSARRFYAALRDRFDGQIACEPRHPSWFTDKADRMLNEFRVARVAADPPPAPGADAPGGWPGLTYYRLHGSPLTYSSPYADEALDGLRENLRRAGGPAWCVFDNTRYGAALINALSLDHRLGSDSAHAMAS